MTGFITAIKRNEIHDGDGLRTTVFFKGCPLKCIWCHNPEAIGYAPEPGFYANKCIHCGGCADACPTGAITMVDGVPETARYKCNGCLECTVWCPTEARKGYGKIWDVESLVQTLLQDKAFFDNSGGGVTLSGGECLSQPAFAIALAKRLWELGVSVDIDTCGYARREIIEQIIPYTDTFLFDLKAIDPQVHARCTGKENGLILENLRYLLGNGCRVEIRYPYVPGYNDTECEKIGAFLRDVQFTGKVKVLGYHNFAGSKYEALSMINTLPDVSVTAEDVEKAVMCLQSFGIYAVNGMTGD